jgi:hypothetical protein
LQLREPLALHGVVEHPVPIPAEELVRLVQRGRLEEAARHADPRQPRELELQRVLLGLQLLEPGLDLLDARGRVVAGRGGCWRRFDDVPRQDLDAPTVSHH